jgi:hypothetical protein
MPIYRICLCLGVASLRVVVGCVEACVAIGLRGKCCFVLEAGMTENEAGMMPSMTNVLVYTYR